MHGDVEGSDGVAQGVETNNVFGRTSIGGRSLSTGVKGMEMGSDSPQSRSATRWGPDRASEDEGILDDRGRRAVTGLIRPPQGHKSFADRQG